MRAATDEADELRRVVREFVRDALPSSEVRAGAASGNSPSPAWKTLSVSLGLTGIGIPERYGGAGYTFGELGIVLEELGAGPVPLPVLSSTVAAAAVLACGDDAARTGLLPELSSGATVAVPVLRAAIAAERDTSGWTLDGVASHVPDAPAASLFVVAADTADGRGLFAVRSTDDGVAVRPRAALDLTRPLGSVEFASARATLLGAGARKWPALALARDTQLAAVACEQVGGAARCLDLTVDYVKTRVQFGVPIGSFQAIKHRCADLLVEIDGARCLADHAREAVATAFDGHSEGVHAAVLAAAAWCADTYVHAAQEAIQMHGGIGFTWEHDIHLHLRRARADQLLYGGPRQHRRELADAIGLGT